MQLRGSDLARAAGSRKAALAIFAVFFFESMVLGQWIPRIPDIKATLALSDASLGLALLTMPLGTLLGFAVAGRLIQITGLRLACRVFLPLWALSFIGPALAQDFLQLCVSLVISGLAIGMIETAMNTEAARIESNYGKRLMSRCHGFWSLGTMIGALSGGLLAQAGVSVTVHFLIAMPLIAIGGYLAASALPVLVKMPIDAAVPDTASALPAATANSASAETLENQEEQKSRLITLPRRAIVLLCVMPLGIMMVEGAFIDWSAVFMRDVMGAEPLTIAIIYSAFSMVMAVVRLSGDALATRFGETVIVRVSGLASTLGICLFALASTVPMAFVAAALSGAGVAIVFPLAVTAAAKRPGRTAAENVAALNMIAFSAFLVSPPIIGFLSEAFSLRFALLCLAPFAFLTFLLATEVQGNGAGRTGA